MFKIFLNTIIRSFTKRVFVLDNLFPTLTNHDSMRYITIYTVNTTIVYYLHGGGGFREGFISYFGICTSLLNY